MEFLLFPFVMLLLFTIRLPVPCTRWLLVHSLPATGPDSDLLCPLTVTVLFGFVLTHRRIKFCRGIVFFLLADDEPAVEK
jgi:hypothetical protein